MFLFCSNSVDSSISSWTKRWTLVLEMLAMFWRQCVNEAVEVSFESRMAQVSAIFHIFKCTFCLLWLILFPYCFRHHPWLFCSRSLLFQCIFLSSIDHSIHPFIPLPTLQSMPFFLTLCLFLFFLSFLFFPRWFFAMISVSGMFAVTFSIAFAYVADCTEESERSTAYGLVRQLYSQTRTSLICAVPH